MNSLGGNSNPPPRWNKVRQDEESGSKQEQISFVPKAVDAEIVRRFGPIPEDSKVCREAYRQKLVQFDGDETTTWMWFLMRKRDIEPGPL